jgi:hypothetical protein
MFHHTINKDARYNVKKNSWDEVVRGTRSEKVDGYTCNFNSGDLSLNRERITELPGFP